MSTTIQLKSHQKTSERRSKTIEQVRARLQKSKAVPRVNLPALARRDETFMRCWQADPGKVFVSSDFVSLEPSITASFADDYNYQYATFLGVGQRPYVTHEGTLMIDDVYLMTASVMPGICEAVREYFSKSENADTWLVDPEIAKEALKKERKQAKPACLGFNYGMGPKRFVTQSYDAGSHVSYDQAKAMYNAYWNLFSGVRELVRKLEAVTKRDGFLINPFGYRLTTEPHKGYNAFIQSTASGVLDVFNLKFFAACPDVEFIALIHDEVIYQVEESRLDEVRRIQEECVVSLNKDLGFEVPMRLGFTVARNFSEIK